MQLTPNKKLIEILHAIPRGIPSDVVKYAYVYVVLKKIIGIALRQLEN